MEKKRRQMRRKKEPERERERESLSFKYFRLFILRLEISVNLISAMTTGPMFEFNYSLWGIYVRRTKQFSIEGTPPISFVVTN